MIFKFMTRGYGKSLYINFSEKDLLDLIKLKAKNITISNSIPFIENSIYDIQYLLEILKGSDKE